MTWLLLVCLRPALLCLDNPARYWYYVPVLLVGFVADVWVAHTVFAQMAGQRPQRGEWTVSQMLERLCSDLDHPQRPLFVQLAIYINRAAGTRHIEAVP
jgi:hypothetical protein